VRENDIEPNYLSRPPFLRIEDVGSLSVAIPFLHQSFETSLRVKTRWEKLKEGEKVGEGESTYLRIRARNQRGLGGSARRVNVRIGSTFCVSKHLLKLELKVLTVRSQHLISTFVEAES